MCWIIKKICYWKVVRNTGQWNLFITGRVSILKCYVTVSLDLTWVGVNSWPGCTSTCPYFTCKPNWIFYHLYLVRCSYDPLTSSKRVVRASYHMLHLYGNGPRFETKHTGDGVHIRSRWQFISGIYWTTCFWACDYVPYSAYQHTSSLQWHKMSVNTSQFTCPLDHLFSICSSLHSHHWLLKGIHSSDPPPPPLVDKNTTINCMCIHIYMYRALCIYIYITYIYIYLYLCRCNNLPSWGQLAEWYPCPSWCLPWWISPSFSTISPLRQCPWNTVT